MYLIIYFLGLSTHLLHLFGSYRRSGQKESSPKSWALRVSRPGVCLKEFTGKFKNVMRVKIPVGFKTYHNAPIMSRSRSYFKELI